MLRIYAWPPPALEIVSYLHQTYNYPSYDQPSSALIGLSTINFHDSVSTVTETFETAHVTDSTDQGSYI